MEHNVCVYSFNLIIIMYIPSGIEKEEGSGDVTSKRWCCD